MEATAPLLQSEALAVFSRHWLPLADTFSASVLHVRRCQLIQFGTCDRADCQVTVGHIEHFGLCRTFGQIGGESPSKECEACEFLLNVLIQHALVCNSHYTCFVPNCFLLKAVAHNVQDPARLAELLVNRLTAAEIRTVVWCLGGGDPNRLFLSTGQNHVRWGDCENVCKL
ncbi:hypothetical protein ACOMHN_011367 [Nucella lapillus]